MQVTETTGQPHTRPGRITPVVPAAGCCKADSSQRWGPKRLQPPNGHLRLHADPNPFGIPSVTRPPSPKSVLKSADASQSGGLGRVAKISQMIRICRQVQKPRAIALLLRSGGNQQAGREVAVGGAGFLGSGQVCLPVRLLRGVSATRVTAQRGPGPGASPLNRPHVVGDTAQMVRVGN